MLTGTWIQIAVPAVTSLLAAVAAATIALIGNHQLQSGLGKRLREAEEIKQRLFHILTLTADYWAVSRHTRKEQEMLEARILAEKNIVISQFFQVQRHTRKLRKWYPKTLEDRLDLIDALTGGSFQQKKWNPDPRRVMDAARAIQSLVSSLNLAC